ncbi:MAG: hypothetical protein KDC07_06625 [Chitinophagaceae bacterium]|nr:hypothetical protein [Chitinophagaceae bacterium]MCB9047201.1 hypothetical protein [Chitinophagales bacterium]
MQKILLIICSGLLLASCNKKRCWECTVDIGGDTFQQEVCDKSKKEIKELQASPQETKDKDGNVIYTTTYSNCTKK